MADNCLQVFCPVCGASFSLEQAWQNEDGRRFVALIMSLPPVVVRPLYGYLTLFKPASQMLRWSTCLKITQELAEIIKTARIKRNGNTYGVSPAQVAEAMQFLTDTRPASLELPLKKNAYLITMLANKAEKALAQTERQQEERKVGGYRERPSETVDAVIPEPYHPPPKKEEKKLSKPPKDFRKNLPI